MQGRLVSEVLAALLSRAKEVTSLLECLGSGLSAGQLRHVVALCRALRRVSCGSCGLSAYSTVVHGAHCIFDFPLEFLGDVGGSA